ncbi:MAG: ATP-binding cassette domain-containing protein, partial [Synergistales bacterium]|nr:ATP-binding cassette domain-containing protein [Synergistales bacterium]
MLEVKNLNAGYGHLQIIRDVNFSVNDGEVIAILGSNGAGKTTTVRAITGMLKPMSGSVNFNGQELCGKSSRAILDAGIIQV